MDLTLSYTVGLRFSYDNIKTGYTKIIDYANSSSDNGFYFLGRRLNFYENSSVGTGSTTIQDNQVVDLIVTRAAGSPGAFKAYFVVNGVLKTPAELSVNINGGKPILVGGKTRFGFFFDDIATSAEATSGGKVYGIKIWDSVLSEDQIQEAMNPKASISDVSIIGATGTPIIPKDILVEIKEEDNSISSIITQNTDVSSWITNLPDGLQARVKDEIVIGSKLFTIEVLGIPTVQLSQPIKMVIPSAILANNKSIYVTQNLNAKFGISPYSITYHGNSNTSGSVPVDNGIYSEGSIATILGNSGNLAKTNSIFLGWNTISNGTGTTYIEGDNYTLTNSNLVLYANWLGAPILDATTSITTSSFRANWFSATGATNYRLDVSTQSNFSSYVDGYNNLSVATTNQIVSGLNPGKVYYFRVRTVNANGDISPSSIITTITTILSAPVTIAATAIKSSAFQANWNPVEGATGYRLDVSTVSNFATFVAGYNNIEVNGTSCIVTGLTHGTIYYYRVRATTSQRTSSNSGTISVATNTAYVWNGIDTSMPTLPSNWDTNVIPGISDDVIISSSAKNLLRVTETMQFLGLNLQDGSIIEISPTGKLTVDNLTSAGTIIIESTDNNTGQFFVTSSDVIGELNKIILRKTFTSGSWYFVSFPFDVIASNVKLAGTTTQAVWGDASDVDPRDFYVMTYDGFSRDAARTSSAQNGIHWIDVPARVFEKNKGYIIAVSSNMSLDFISSAGDSSPFTESEVGVSKYATSPRPNHRSWNLIGQPYLSSFNLLNATQSHTPYYYYNGSNYVPVMADESYVVYPFTAFFVQAHGADNNVEYAIVGRTLRSVSAPGFEQVALIIQDNEVESFTDKARIRLQEGRTVNYELGFDAIKMLSMNAQAPQIYTRTKGTDNVTISYAVNSLPTNTSIVDLVVSTGKAGSYTVSLENINDAPSYSSIILVVGTQEYDLLEGAYTFSTTKAQTMNWKVKLVQGVATQVAQTADNGIDVATINNQVYINGLESEAMVSVYNVSGKLVQIISNVQNNQALNINNTGVSVLTITTTTQQAQAKVLVE